jgi:hypothetical protein
MHDYWIFLVAAAGGRSCVLSDELVDYRQHERNVVGKRRITAGQALPRLRRRWRVVRGEAGEPELWRDRRRLWSESADRIRELARRNPATADLLLGKLAFEQRRLSGSGKRSSDVSAALRLAKDGGYRAFSSSPRASLCWDLIDAIVGRRADAVGD